MTKTLNFLCFLSLAGFLVIGCSSTSFVSNEKIPVVFEKRESHTRDISVKATREFYLWGLFPTTHELSLDEEFFQQGYRSISEVRIDEEKTGKDLAWTFFTLGFYVPKTYVLTGKAKDI